MRFLIYGLNFRPELIGIGKYTGELVDSLIKKGHQVTVITAPPYYPAWRIGQGYRASRYTTEESHNLKVIRCPLYVPRRVSGIKRIIHLLSFAITSAPVVQREARQKPDLILAIAPAIFAAPAAARAGKRFGIRTWLHIQDFETEAALNLDIFKLGRVINHFRTINKLESSIYKRFERVSSISAKMVERLKDKGVPAEKTVYFPNWVDTEVIYPLEVVSEYRKKLRFDEEAVVVLYSGSMSIKQGLEVILDSARQVIGKDKIYYVLCGDGPAKQSLQQSAQGLTNVHFLPLQPADKLNQLLNLADIHLIPQKRVAADLVMPSKLLGILASGKPVIAGCMPGSELYNVVSEVGEAIEPENSTALTETILSLAGELTRRRELGAKGRAYCVEHFSKNLVIDNFVEEIETLLGISP